MSFSPPSANRSNTLDRPYDSVDIPGASYRILKALEEGHSVKDALNNLGQRPNDPEDFTKKSVINLINEVRLFLAGRIAHEPSNLSRGSIHVGKEMNQHFPEIQASAEKIAVVVSAVHDHLKRMVNRSRIQSHRFPIS